MLGRKLRGVLNGIASPHRPRVLASLSQRFLIGAVLSCRQKNNPGEMQPPAAGELAGSLTEKVLGLSFQKFTGASQTIENSQKPVHGGSDLGLSCCNCINEYLIPYHSQRGDATETAS